MRSNRRLRWAAIPVAVTLAVVLAGCTQAELHGYLPGFVEGEAPVTNHTERIAGLWTTSWIVLLVVGLLTWGLIIWAIVVYRRRKGQTGLPVQMRYNMPIEIFYTIVPLILVLGFFAFTARDQAAIETQYENPDVEIEVFAKQWAWDFIYRRRRRRRRLVRRRPGPAGRRRRSRHHRPGQAPDPVPAGRGKTSRSRSSRATSSTPSGSSTSSTRRT